MTNWNKCKVELVQLEKSNTIRGLVRTKAYLEDVSVVPRIGNEGGGIDQVIGS